MKQEGENGYSFTIGSASEVDMAGAKMLTPLLRSEQKKSWNEVMDNFVKTSGGKEDKSKRNSKVIDPKK